MAQNGYNTNLAAEFYVLSVLHRLGVDANLTLGNKKSVDIAAVRSAGRAVTIDVKGLAGTTAWPVDNLKTAKAGHFIVFVCYRGKIDDPTVLPEVWVIPSSKVAALTYHSPNGKRRVVQRSTLRAKAMRYRDQWALLV
ncbi:MAG: hypothetical protein ACYCXT_01035 [Acidiferrobacteraceae bacterium]